VKEQITEAELDKKNWDGRYENCWDEVKGRFANEPNVELVRGAVPDALQSVKATCVSYCSIDMNCAAPEVDALEFVWPILSDGGLIVFDDYGFPKHEVQRVQLDGAAKSLGCSILTLPTGQGLLVK
jgi:hypothetical protein